MRRPVRLLAATAASALLLAGCTGGDEPETDGSATSTATAEEAQAAEETTDELRDAAGEDAEPQPVTATLPVLGSRETTAGDTPLQVDLNDVWASGEVMTVLFTVTTWPRTVATGRSPGPSTTAPARLRWTATGSAARSSSSSTRPRPTA